MKVADTLFRWSNLQWTASGTVWATWQLTPMTYGVMSTDLKYRVRAAHFDLLKSLSRDAVLEGVTVVSTGEDVRAAMQEGVDPVEHPDWATECDAAAEWADARELGHRSFWLSVPLPLHGWDRLTIPLWAALNTLLRLLGLQGPGPSPDAQARMQQTARSISDRIPKVFEIRAATDQDLRWLMRKRCHREAIVGGPPTPSDAEPQVHPGPGGVVPIVDAYALSDEEKPRSVSMTALSRQAVKITDPLRDSSSYQVPLLVAEVPSEEMQFPGGTELFRIADTMSFDVDYTIRMHVISNHDALAKTNRSLGHVRDQRAQREDVDDVHDATEGGQGDLNVAEGLLKTLQDRLRINRNEAVVRSAMYFLITGDTLEQALERAAEFIEAADDLGVGLVRPVGLLDDMWWQAQAGVSTSGISVAHGQHTTVTDFAATVPCTDSRVGSDSGLLLAENRGTSRRSLVYLPADTLCANNLDGSVACVAEKGAGKTFTLMYLAGAIRDRGGQVLCVDHSDQGEYARWANAVKGSVIVDFDNPKWSMDPLRMLGLERGRKTLSYYLASLAGISGRDPVASALAQVLQLDYLREFGIKSTADLVDHLRVSEVPYAEELFARLQAFRLNPLADVMFDGSLPPIDLAASTIVWRAHTLQLPTDEDLQNEIAFRDLPAEVHISRAFYSMLARVMLTHCAEDNRYFTAIVNDEIRRWTSHRETAGLVERFLSESRRANAGLYVGAQDAKDLGDRAELIRTRIVLRQTSRSLAERSIEFLGKSRTDPDFEDLVEDVMMNCSPADKNGVVPENRRGEGYLVDQARQCAAPIRILGPLQAARRAAADTTPGVRAA